MPRNMQSGSFWRNNISSLVPSLQRLGCTSKVFLLSSKASFLVEMSSTSPCGDAYAFFNAAYLCLLIPPYPVFEIEMKISLV